MKLLAKLINYLDFSRLSQGSPTHNQALLNVSAILLIEITCLLCIRCYLSLEMYRHSVSNLDRLAINFCWYKF